MLSFGWTSGLGSHDAVRSFRSFKQDLTAGKEMCAPYFNGFDLRKCRLAREMLWNYSHDFEHRWIQTTSIILR